MKRKILFVTPHLPDEQSGHAGSVLIYREIEKLNQDYDVTLVSLCTRSELSHLNRLSHCSQVLPVIPRKRFKNIAVSKTWNFILEIWNWLRFFLRNEPYWISKYYFPHFAEELTQLNKSNDIDIAIFESSIMAQYVHNVKAKIKIIREHEIPFKMIEEYQNRTRSFFQRKYWKFQHQKWIRYFENIYKHFDKIVTLTDEDKSVLSQIVKSDKITTMPPGIVINPLTKPSKIQNSLFFMGAFNRRANRVALNNFIENIFPKILEKLPDTELWIIGNKPPARFTKTPPDGVNFIGFIDEIEEFLEKGSVFIAPILVGSGLKMKILHAMARALPVVTTKVGSEGISAQNEKDLIIAKDDDAFINGIVSLLSNEKKRAKMGKNARKFVQNMHSVEADTTRWIDLIEQLCRE